MAVLKVLITFVQGPHIFILQWILQLWCWCWLQILRMLVKENHGQVWSVFCFIELWHLEYRNVGHFLIFSSLGKVERVRQLRKHLMRVKLFKGTRSSVSTVTVFGVRCSQGSGDWFRHLQGKTTTVAWYPLSAYSEMLGLLAGHGQNNNNKNTQKLSPVSYVCVILAMPCSIWDLSFPTRD